MKLNKKLAKQRLSQHKYHKRTKQKYVNYKGGKCQVCRYDKCLAALEFHHINPKEKDFSINFRRKGAEKEIEKELDKCILVCANCHREIHQYQDK